jgi:septum formation protein
MSFILASASPRRRELISLLGIADLKIIKSAAEASFSGSVPEDIVRSVALSKAQSVAPMCSRQDIILAADTLVFLDGQQLGKPRDEQQAFDMLRALSGRTHTVSTGMAIITDSVTRTCAETTSVTFRHLTDREITDYIATGEPMDKAGAYGIQGRGALFITGIQGDYYNVVGLPVCRLGMMLREMGIIV